MSTHKEVSFQKHLKYTHSQVDTFCPLKKHNKTVVIQLELRDSRGKSMGTPIKEDSHYSAVHVGT